MPLVILDRDGCRTWSARIAGRRAAYGGAGGRLARRYGAVVGLSGGLIGPDGTPRDYPGTFDATPLFLGCSDVDPHIAMHRVVEAGEVFKRMFADVAIRFYPGMAHTVSVEELDQVLALVESI